MAQYNLKMIDYDEFVQYRIYDRVISKEDKNNDQNEREEREENNNVAKNRNDEEKEKEHSESVSINRTIQTIYKYAQANRWEWFVTLTFKRDGKVNAYEYSDAVKKLTVWLNNQRKKARALKYLFVPERHKDGAWHFHGLMADCSGLAFSDSGRVAIGSKAYVRTEENKDHPWIYNMDGWRYGFSTATKVQSSCKASSYICKYITKDMLHHIGKYRRFYPSNNLLRPVESEHLLDEDSMEKLKIEISDSIDYMKSQAIPEAGQVITYITVMKERQVDHDFENISPL